MNKVAFSSLLLPAAFLFLTSAVFSQNPSISESIIKYDLTTHKADKPIPFDRSFTLIVDKLPKKGFHRADVYEVIFEKGRRKPAVNNFIDCNGKRQNQNIRDMQLQTNPYSDTLQLFFPPLKPNIDFDVYVIYDLNGATRDLLLKANAMIAGGETGASKAYDVFFKATIDKLFLFTPTSIISYSEYRPFFDQNLALPYTELSDAGNYKDQALLTEEQVKAIDIVSSAVVSDFKDGNKLLEVSKRNLWKAFQQGLFDINKVFLPEREALTSLSYAHIRLKNYESNVNFIDSVMKRINRAISNDSMKTKAGNVLINNNEVRTAIEKIRNNLDNNFFFLKSKMEIINKHIDDENRLKQGVHLSANTTFNDIKTAGGNILFFDAGFTNLLMPGTTGKATYIPKLYWGVSIYFRPIDKNTRSTRFPRKFEPEENNGCNRRIVRDTDGAEIGHKDAYGPDYGVATKWSIWQHLSLKLGFTLGSMANKDYDNFYNGTSLLVGPAYRFARAFKVSAGAAFLKRTSKNPLVSDKKVVAGGYLSLSVDIDLIQGLKDITNILFK